METALKFKVGDRVVIVRATSCQEHLLMKRGTIERLTDDGEVAVGKTDSDQLRFDLFTYKLEHEHVYDSPLYKALG